MSLLCKYGDFKPFYPHDVALPGTKILLKLNLTFWIFRIFCHILLHAYNCIFWHLFPSFPYFGISICHFYWYLFLIIFPFWHIILNFPTFFPHILSFLSYDHDTKGFVFQKNQKIKMTLDEWRYCQFVIINWKYD